MVAETRLAGMQVLRKLRTALTDSGTALRIGDTRHLSHTETIALPGAGPGEPTEAIIDRVALLGADDRLELTHETKVPGHSTCTTTYHADGNDVLDRVVMTQTDPGGAVMMHHETLIPPDKVVSDNVIDVIDGNVSSILQRWGLG